MALDGFDEDLVVRGGGWDGRYARVLLIEQVSETRAVAVVDPNGDGADMNLDLWDLTSDGWRPGASRGIGPLAPGFGVTRGWTDGVAFATGVAEAGETVTVPWLRAGVTAAANEFGVWLVAEEADADAV